MISSSEYTQELLRRCRRREALNAFITLDPDALLARAREADRRRDGEPGPLYGVPLAVKDNIDVAGQVTTGGTPALRDHVVNRDAETWRRLRVAGALLLGKTNMHELAFGVTGNNRAFGPTLNPWAADRTAGGSSSGTAAAVAARLAPAGLGTDTGGSVRIPAAHCATAGLRPSRGRYGQHGVLLLSRTRDTVGVIARSVVDIALLDSVIAPSPGHAGRTAPALPWPGVRLGVPRRPFWRDLDPATAAVAERRLDDLSRAGAVLVEADLPDQVMEQVPEAGMAIAEYEARRELPYYLAQTPPSPTYDELVDQIADPDVHAPLGGAANTPPSAYQTACRSAVPLFEATLTDYVRAHRLDALVYPTCPVAAQPVGHDETVRLNGRDAPTFATYIRNTDLASVIGWPALALPAGLGDDGLPVGLELCGPPHSDRRLLRLGTACEGLWEWPSAPD
ncbi:amidase family protein [Actinomadura hibisca]|uniref:amidase family protein n=1 Tax=Actinomadura hibisca TaxID=68565 RepID=UPI001470F0BC|nr:amidase family protein [Actinomadura hibisca]